MRVNYRLIVDSVNGTVSAFDEELFGVMVVIVRNVLGRAWEVMVTGLNNYSFYSCLQVCLVLAVLKCFQSLTIPFFEYTFSAVSKKIHFFIFQVQKALAICIPEQWPHVKCLLEHPPWPDCYQPHHVE